MKHTTTSIFQLLIIFLAVAVFFAHTDAMAGMGMGFPTPTPTPDEGAPPAATMSVTRLPSITSQIHAPTAVAVDRFEHIYVIASTDRLLVYNPLGKHIKTLTGLAKPISVAVDASGRIFIGNSDIGNVEVYNTDFTLLFKLGIGDGEFSQPNAIVLDSAENIYVADSKEDRITVYHPDGSFNFSFGSSGSGNGEFHFPVSIAIDESAGELIVADLQLVNGIEGSRIQVFDLNGGFKRSFGEYGTGAGKLAKPLGVEVDTTGRIYVSDAYQNVVQVFDSDGDVIQVYDSGGTLLEAIYDPVNPMRTPLGLALGESNRLFIASLNTSQVDVYRITTDSLHAFMTTTPASHNFGDTTVGSASFPQMFTVFNVGDGDLVIDPITVAGPEAAEFLLQNDNCSDQTIAPSGRCTMEIVFSPSSEGAKNATLSIPSNDPGRNPYEILLTAYIADTSPTADFTGSPTNGTASLEVNFSGNSMAYDQPLGYEWDFDNNGTIDSTDQNPSYTYTEPGTYSVKLTVTDSDGSTNTLIRTNYITVVASHTVTVHTNNNGRVTSFSAGIDCGIDCTETYEEGTVVTLTAIPAATFVDWAGDGCDRAVSDCTLVLYADTTITATFAFSSDPGTDPDPGSAVPEPTMLLLFGSGLIGIFALGLRKLKRKDKN